MTPQTAAVILLRVFSGIPLAFRKALFITLAFLFYLVVPRQRFIALHNLSRAFPEKSPAEIGKIARGVYRHIGILAAEFFESPRLTREKILQSMTIEGWEHCRRALEKGKGMLLLTGHLGNWELSVTIFALLVKPLTAIYRPLDNPVLEAMVRQIRESAGNKTLPKDRAMRPMLRTLKQNGVLGILIDQNVAWYEGVFVPFFGRKACTTDGIALLALHTGAPVLPGFLIRQTDGRYLIKFLAEVETIRTGDRRQDVLTNTRRYNEILEELIRQYPDQWLWIHHRWKTRPSQVRERA